MVVRVGTSGFSYKHWKRVFYPDDVPQRKWLEYYTNHFNTLEINASFYRLPQKKTVEGWYERTPKDFNFVFKGSKVVTHIKKLKDCEDEIKAFYRQISYVKEKLGPVLWQIPPGLKIDETLLEAFLSTVVSGSTPVIEFRNATWYTDRIFSLLEEKGASLCLHDMPGSKPPDVVTSPVLYLRFHGLKGRYRGNYPDEHLKARAEWVKSVSPSLCYAFFNNDVEGYAPKNAKTLKDFFD